MSRPRTILLLTLLALALPADGAQAAYTPPALVSYNGPVLADSAYSAAISQSGEYVAFAGSFDDVSGIYRKDLATGAVELVAGASNEDPAINAPEAGAPSISANGRYVSFTTAARLDPDNDPGGGCTSVYVRDMDIPASSPGAYILASALNGSTKSLTYTGGTPGSPCTSGGSAAADRVALSADGREVAFTVISPSNLTGSPSATETAPNQVAVRNLDTDTTTLVSQTMSSLGSTPQPVPDGAAISLGEAPLQGSEGRVVSGSTAAISADGSTVAWMGIDIPAQAPASSEQAAFGGDGAEFPAQYAEPLWRRIGDGPDAPTRRVTGGDDPLGCPEHCAGPLNTGFDLESGQHLDTGPEYGTFVAIGGFGGDPLVGGITSLDSVTPQLSADGQTVALLSTQPETGTEPTHPQGASYSLTANAYIVNMASGLSRTQALTRLTEWASDSFSEPAQTGAITTIAISPDGTQVAFTTARVDFPLAPPALITPSLGAAGAQQLYVANLAAGTLALVSSGYEGQPANGNVASPSFAGNDAHTLVFASRASNLVFGAYNQGGANIFLASEALAPSTPGIEYLGTPPATPAPSPSWELLLSARARSDGTALLYATVPATGSLKATAKASLVVRTAARAGKAKRSRISTRTVASVTAHPLGAGLVQLRLKTPASDRSLLERHDGLFATVSVVFTAPHRPTLRGIVQVTFHRAPTKPTKKSAKQR
jgi:Tol biopolymer transport system component